MSQSRINYSSDAKANTRTRRSPLTNWKIHQIARGGGEIEYIDERAQEKQKIYVQFLMVDNDKICVIYLSIHFLHSAFKKIF
jgi:hypothetical protein